MPYRRYALSGLFLAAAVAAASGQAGKQPAEEKTIPPKGVVVPEADLVELKSGLEELGKQIDDLKKSLRGPNADLIPDVEIYHKAVRYGVEFNELYIDKGRDDVKAAKAQLKTGMDRAAELKAGKPS